MTLPRVLLLPVLTLGVGSWCPAAVTYVDPPDITIPFSFQGVYLNLETEATPPSNPSEGPGTFDSGPPASDFYEISYSEPADWDVNFFFGGAIIAHNTTFQPYRTDGSDTGNLSAIHKMTFGTTIDGSSVGVSQVDSTGPTYNLGGSGTTTGGDINGNQSPTHMEGSVPSGAPQFTSGSGDTGYIAFVLNPNTTPLYGWIEVTLADDGSTGTINRWAYEDTGLPLDVGTIPEPSSTLLLLLSSLALLRRKRA